MADGIKQEVSEIGAGHALFGERWHQRHRSASQDDPLVAHSGQLQLNERPSEVIEESRNYALDIPV
jgi:hypothetical protein